MAASVRIEDEAFSDMRYERLAVRAGLVDADHARGKMARLWRQCTLENRHVLPIADVTLVLGNNAIEALTFACLGELEEPGFVRIRGTRGRIEWLKTLRKNGKYGKLGGRPKKTLEGTQEGLLNQTPPAPAPAPAPAHSQDLPSGDLVRRAKRKVPATALPADWAPNPKACALATERGLQVAAQADHFRDWARSKGQTYSDWDAAFSNWLRNSERFGRTGPAKPVVRDRARELWELADRLEAEDGS